jgi:hypothetical protein
MTTSALVGSLLLANDDMPFVATLSYSIGFFSPEEYLNSPPMHSLASSSTSSTSTSTCISSQETEEFKHIKKTCDITICEKTAAITLLKTTNFDAVISIQDPNFHGKLHHTTAPHFFLTFLFIYYDTTV